MKSRTKTSGIKRSLSAKGRSRDEAATDCAIVLERFQAAVTEVRRKPVWQAQIGFGGDITLDMGAKRKCRYIFRQGHYWKGAITLWVHSHKWIVVRRGKKLLDSTWETLSEDTLVSVMMGERLKGILADAPRRGEAAAHFTNGVSIVMANRKRSKWFHSDLFLFFSGDDCYSFSPQSGLRHSPVPNRLRPNR